MLLAVDVDLHEKSGTLAVERGSFTMPQVTRKLAFGSRCSGWDTRHGIHGMHGIQGKDMLVDLPQGSAVIMVLLTAL